MPPAHQHNETETIFLNKINSHKGIIYRIARLYIENETERQDLVQEMIYQLWRSFQNFEGKSSFSTWMYRVCLNTALTYSKKNNSSIRNHQDEKLHLSGDEQPHELNEKIEILYQIIQTLSEVERALIFLYLEGLSGKEIADNLGISEVNVRVKINRIKDKMKIKFKAYGYEY
jgi:RNA polymerase sigma-70 factor (ECF subfamily)